MQPRYINLISPLDVGTTGVTLKNRLHSSNAIPHFLQGPEPFPADPMVSYYAGLAKNGAGIVTFRPSERKGPRQSIAGKDSQHMPIYNYEDLAVENSFSLVSEVIHFYGAKVMVARRFAPEGYSISGGGATRAATPEVIRQMAADAAREALYYKNLGFDGMALVSSLSSDALCPAKNTRTDEFGGSLRNRVRISQEMFQAVKKACGSSFLIETIISASDVYPDYGLPVGDLAEYARIMEGLVDIMQIRPAGPLGIPSHTTGYNSVRDTDGDPEALRYSMLVKAAGTRILTAPNTDFLYVDKGEEYIRDGRMDLFSSGRTFIRDPEFGRKVYEGRGEDIVPCIRCNKCHVPTFTGPWVSVCSVNPIHGIANRIDRMVDKPETVKKVAVIGGGPAGMEAALTARQRGHQVTLYERSGRLGGQLNHADYVPFKWPLADLVAYLGRQLEKTGVDVRLNTEATPDGIREAGYDAVIVAVGAVPNRLSLPGADGANVFYPLEVFPRLDQLGKRVVVVGGSETGTETAVLLAQRGHEVTLLTRQDKIAGDCPPIHYIEHIDLAISQLPNFHALTRATTTCITPEAVVYTDENGAEQSVSCDSVVLSSGMKPCKDLARSFFGSAPLYFAIGDCDKVGNVQKCFRAAFAAASSL